MDPKEKYMTTLIRSLIKKGVITFVSSAASAIAIGPYGFVIGPVLTSASAFLENSTEEEQIAGWSSMSKNDIFKLAIHVAIKLAIDNIAIIIKICKDIIRLLKRLFEVREESIDNVRTLVQHTPSGSKGISASAKVILYKFQRKSIS